MYLCWICYTPLLPQTWKAAGLLATVVGCHAGPHGEACSSDTDLKNDRAVGLPQRLGQRGWQSQEVHCNASTVHVQGMDKPPLWQPQAGELWTQACISSVTYADVRLSADTCAHDYTNVSRVKSTWSPTARCFHQAMPSLDAVGSSQSQWLQSENSGPSASMPTFPFVTMTLMCTCSLLHLHKPCGAGCGRASCHLQFPQTSGTAAVIASVAAAVRESLMLSAPADAMLSSGLFAAFTHEVAARIIQHYWREHANRRLTAKVRNTASAIPQQRQAHLAEQEADPSDGDICVPDQADQEESLAEAMMRYRREDDTTAAASRNIPQQVASSRLQVTSGHSLLEQSATASAARVSHCADVSVEVTQASVSSLDKLKQRRLERPTAQHTKVSASKADTNLLPDTSQQHRSAAVASRLPAAGSAQHAQQAPYCKAQDSSCPAQPAGPQLLTDSSRGLEQESSDIALLQMLNPRRHVHSRPPPVKPPRVSTDSMPLQQQQQEPHGTKPVHGAAEPQAGSGENVSPNLTPKKLHAKRLSNQTKHEKVPAAAASGFVHQEPNPSVCELSSDHTGDKAADASPTPVALHSSSQRQKSERLSSNKLADIFAFLDNVEAQAEAEAAAVVQSHALHKPSLHDLAVATSANFHAASASLHHPPATTDGHQQPGHQQQHQPGLSHLKQNVNRQVGSSVSQRSHEAACSSSVDVSTGSQATGADHKPKTSVATFWRQTSAAHEQTASTEGCAAETGSAGQLLAATSAFPS